MRQTACILKDLGLTNLHGTYSQIIDVQEHFENWRMRSLRYSAKRQKKSPAMAGLRSQRQGIHDETVKNTQPT